MVAVAAARRMSAVVELVLAGQEPVAQVAAAQEAAATGAVVRTELLTPAAVEVEQEVIMPAEVMAVPASSSSATRI
jgi:hypothetical protein